MHIELEMVSRFTARTLVAFAVSCLLYSFWWWSAVISFPLLMVIGGYLWKPKWAVQTRYLVETKSLDVLKSLFFRMVILYLFGSAAIFQWHLGSWYGWLAGGAVGGVLAYAMVRAQRHWLGFRS